MRRSEQCCLKILFTSGHILVVAGGSCLPAIQMMKCMITNSMTSLPDQFENLRVFHHVVADTEECNLNIPLLKYFQYRRGCLRNRSIVEGEINFILRGGYIADQVLSAEEPENERRFDMANTRQGL